MFTNNPVKIYIPPRMNDFYELCDLIEPIKSDDPLAYKKISTVFSLIDDLQCHSVIEQFIMKSSFKNKLHDARITPCELYGGNVFRKTKCPSNIFELYCYFYNWWTVPTRRY